MPRAARSDSCCVFDVPGVQRSMSNEETFVTPGETPPVSCVAKKPEAPLRVLAMRRRCLLSRVAAVVTSTTLHASTAASADDVVVSGATGDTSGIAGRAASQKDPVELRWVRLEGAEQCPPKATFEAALEKRLGRATFSDRGSRVLTISLSNEKGPFRAVLSLKQRSSEEVESKQELFSYSSQCDEVFAATVLSVALLLNPDEMEERVSPIEDETDNGFFDPPSADVGIGVPSDNEAHGEHAVDAAPGTYEIPMAPRPWVRTHGTLTGALIVGIEQLPRAAMGFSARTDWPLARAWLLWLSADWFQSAPTPKVGTGVTVVQTSGWIGGSWVPYNNEVLELHLLGGLGVRQVAATLTASEPGYHVAMQLGVGVVAQISPQFAFDARAAAVVPFRSELVGSSWAQPAIGGQLQVGVSIGIPNPPAPH